jgi:hypothetical protein
MHARFALQVNPGRSLVVGSVRVSMSYIMLPQLCRLVHASIRRRSAAVAAAAAAAVGGRGGRKVSIQPTSPPQCLGDGLGWGLGVESLVALVRVRMHIGVCSPDFIIDAFVESPCTIVFVLSTAP